MWVFLSLLAGLADALRDSLSKKHTAGTPRILLAWAYTTFALPFFLPCLLLRSWPELHRDFFIMLAGVGCCHVLGGILLVRALSSSELSLCIPMAAFTPVFLLLFGAVFHHELPTFLGGTGSLLVVLGCYLLNLRDLRSGLLAPFRAMAREEGVRIMFFLSFLWAVTCTVDRVAVARYDLFFWGCIELLTVSIFFLPLLFHNRGMLILPDRRTRRGLLIVGAMNGLSLAAYLGALQLAPAYYIIALKRSSILFSLVFGRIFFQEAGSRGRVPGAFLMFTGVVLVSIWG